jgi:hypothetical protein
MIKKMANMMRFDVRRRTVPSWARQSGVALAQGLMSATLVGSMSMVGMDWAVKQAAIDRERAQAQSFLLINSAAGNYLSHFNDQLVALKADGSDFFPAACATISMKVGAANAVPPIISSGGCKATLVLTQHSDGSADKTYTVQNALQPTLAELKAMGIMDAGVSEVPLLAVTNEVLGSNSQAEAGTQPAPNTYTVVLYPRCITAGTAGGALPTQCAIENKAFTTLVFNNQPFDLGGSSSQNLAHLLGALGPDGAISGPAETGVTDPTLRINPSGDLRSLGRGWSISNPIQQNWSYQKNGADQQYTRGADGIAAVRNGYDATTALEYTRRDGSSPPTADWDFNGKSITNIGNLQVGGSIAGKNGTLMVNGNQNVSGNQSVQGNQTVAGSLTVGKAGTAGGAATGVFTALADMIVNGATELKGKLTVAGAALFKGEVTFEQLVKAKDITLTGQLSASSATVSGDIQGGSLHIGYTAITADGTLLGSKTGWGVNVNESCATGAEYALAQNTSGQLMICRSGHWQQLINRENTVIAAPGLGQACSPDGSAGRLPDGTLAICTGGQWQSAAQGGVSTNGACSVKGAISTTMPSGSSDYLDAQKYVMVVCDGAKWVQAPLARPLPQYASVGWSCGLNNEVGLDGRLDTQNPALVACVNGVWSDISSLKVSVQSGNWLGDACKPNGAFSLDTNGTGLLVCANGVWSKPTEAVGIGTACTQSHNTLLTTPSGKRMWCAYSKWQDFPDYIELVRWDGIRVNMIKGVKSPVTGEVFYLYSEPAKNPSASTWQTMNDLNRWVCPRHMLPGYDSLPCDDDDVDVGSRFTNYSIQITQLSKTDAYAFTDAFGGRPSLWEGGPLSGSNGEFWTRTPVWNNDPGWHVTVDLWNKHTFDRWATDYYPVVFRVKGY